MVPVQETALSLGLDNSALGKELVSPYINTIQPVRTLLNTVLTKLDPTLGESDLVLEIVLSVLAGEGSLDIDLGGAYATTDGTAYVNPLDGSAGSGPSDSTSPGQDDSGLGGAPILEPTPWRQRATRPPRASPVHPSSGVRTPHQIGASQRVGLILRKHVSGWLPYPAQCRHFDHAGRTHPGPDLA